MYTKQLGLLVVVTALLGGCGGDDAGASESEDFVPVDEPVLDGKSDAISKLTLKGDIAFGQTRSSTFDVTRYDGWTFDAAKGATVSLSLTGDPKQKTDTVLFLYGPKQGAGWGKSALAKDDDGAGGKFSLLADFALPSAGQYLIVASAKNKSFHGKTYTLALECGGQGCEPDLPPATAAIHVEVDFVGYQRFVPGTVGLITDYFASIGYAIDFVADEELEPQDFVPYGDNQPALVDYYLNHFQHRGQPGWYYLLMADKVGQFGVRGWGGLGKDLFTISADPVALYPGHEAEAQANIILHELGHNLGLVHEGFEPEKSAGTHSKSTCATADKSPTPPVPVVLYSPVCVEHIDLHSTPYAKP